MNEQFRPALVKLPMIRKDLKAFNLDSRVSFNTLVIPSSGSKNCLGLGIIENDQGRFLLVEVLNYEGTRQIQFHIVLIITTHTSEFVLDLRVLCIDFYVTTPHFTWGSSKHTWNQVARAIIKDTFKATLPTTIFLSEYSTGYRTFRYKVIRKEQIALLTQCTRHWPIRNKLFC